MKNTKKNVIELLKKMRNVSNEMTKLQEKFGEKEVAKLSRRESWAYGLVIDLLTDEQFYEEWSNIYNK